MILSISLNQILNDTKVDKNATKWKNKFPYYKHYDINNILCIFSNK